MDKRWELFRMLPLSGVRFCENFAASLSAEKRRDAMSRRSALLDELMQARAVHASNARAWGARNHVADCVLDRSSLSSLMEKYCTSTKNDLHCLETASFKPIEVPDVTVRGLIDGDEVQAATVLPWWAKHIAVHRDHCRKLIISADSSFSGKAWLVLLCKQQPWTVTTLELRRVHIGIDLCHASLEEVLDKDKISFELFPLSYVKAVDVPINSADEVFVLQGAYVDGRRIMSRCEVVGLDVFTSTLLAVSDSKKRKATSKPRNKAHKPDAIQALLARYPWLTEAEVKLAVGAQGGVGKPSGSAKRRRLNTDGPQEEGDLSSSSDDGRSDDAAEGGEQPEVRVFQADDLEQLRALEERGEHKEMDFVVKMRGGAWTLQNKGEIADSAACFARKG